MPPQVVGLRCGRVHARGTYVQQRVRRSVDAEGMRACTHTRGAAAPPVKFGHYLHDAGEEADETKNAKDEERD
jgi:hypothetical protein